MSRESYSPALEQGTLGDSGGDNGGGVCVCGHTFLVSERRLDEAAAALTINGTGHGAFEREICLGTDDPMKLVCTLYDASLDVESIRKYTHDYPRHNLLYPGPLSGI